MVTVAGVDARSGGNWYINQATHVIGPGTVYLTTLELLRNAVGVTEFMNSPKNADTNTAPGPDKADSSKDVRVHFDGDSRFSHRESR